METKIKDLKINYTVQGTGENYILLQGWGTNIDLYRCLTDNISKKVRIYCVDLPGFGKSEEPKEGWNLDEYVEFVIEFAKQMGIDNVNLIGHSFGGRIIIKLLNKKDLDIKTGKIILIGSAGIKHELSFKRKVKVAIYKIGKRVLSIKIIKKLFPKMLENLLNNAGSADYRNATPVMKECMKKCINEDLTQLLPNIKNSVLLIWGENDTETPLEDGKTMNKLIKDSGLIQIKGGTHYAFLEQSQYVNRIIDSFIN